jgi:hypothetical protein
MNGRDVDQLLDALRAEAVVRRQEWRCVPVPAPALPARFTDTGRLLFAVPGGHVEKWRALVDRAAWTIDGGHPPAGLGPGTDV